MPYRNVVKNDLPETYYHIYARGHYKNDIFRDDEDYRVFLNMTKRCFYPKNDSDKYNRFCVNLTGAIELNAYCLMSNHFHLLCFQIEPTAMATLMRSVLTSYSRYFNKKYGLSGALFETTYKASIISDDTYLVHISRYIHINPKKWRSYEYSSLPYYIDRNPPEWLRPDKIMDLFSGPNEYLKFIADYETQKIALKETKSN